MMYKFLAVAAFCVLLVSCGNGSPVPNEQRAIEQLMTDVLRIGVKKGYPMPMFPAQQVEVMREAMSRNGWSLSATLENLAEQGVNPLGVDMKLTLILLTPSDELPQEQLRSLYSSKELADITRLRKMLDGMN